MSEQFTPESETWALFDAACGDALDTDQVARLEAALRADERLCDLYLDYFRLHAELSRSVRLERARDKVIGAIRQPESVNSVPPIVLDFSSTSHYPLTTSRSFVDYPVFPFLAATVIVGVMLLGFWAIKITHHQPQVAGTPSKSVPSDVRPERTFVGRITGLVDVKWSDDPRFLPPYGYAHVPLGRKYKLDSGLMEITYDSGAKVILEGPCTYEVESTAGGYLALGKLTARVEAVEGKGSRSKVQGSRSTSLTTSHQPLATNSNPQSLIPNPLFAIRTPTAIVTDLGTEFGVEVDDRGGTASRVFRGSVRVQLVGGDGGQREVVLGENESARVEKNEGGGGPRLVLHGAAANPSAFVRQIAGPPKVLDLLDIVAGGDGTGRRRERGIDPTSGGEDPLFVPGNRDGNRRYWPVPWHKHKLIDGVFVPDTAAGAVRLDSAGHVFDRFPANSGRAYGSIWAREARLKPQGETTDQARWVYAMGLGEQFMPEMRGLLGMTANSGITFDLEAIRQAHLGVVPARFHAVAGLPYDLGFFPPAGGLADVWVFVDGGLKLKRIGVCPQDDPFDVDVELGPHDRFLTLVSTDGGNGINSDWVVFGDPVLKMTRAASQESVEDK